MKVAALGKTENLSNTSFFRALMIVNIVLGFPIPFYTLPYGNE